MKGYSEETVATVERETDCSREEAIAALDLSASVEEAIKMIKRSGRGGDEE